MPTKTKAPKTIVAPERTFTIDLGAMFPRYVNAMKSFASTDDARYVLTGVHFTRTVDGYLKLTATDSYKLGIVETMTHVPVDFEPFVLRHKDLVEMVKAMGKGAVMFVLNVDLVTGHATLTNGVDSKVTSVICGEFPNVANLIPATDPKGTPKHVAFTPQYLGDICAATKALDPKGNHPIRFIGGIDECKPHIWRAIVQDVGSLFGLLMPVRVPGLND